MFSGPSLYWSSWSEYFVWSAGNHRRESAIDNSNYFLPWSILYESPLRPSIPLSGSLPAYLNLCLHLYIPQFPVVSIPAFLSSALFWCRGTVGSVARSGLRVLKLTPRGAVTEITAECDWNCLLFLYTTVGHEGVKGLSSETKALQSQSISSWVSFSFFACVQSIALYKLHLDSSASKRKQRTLCWTTLSRGAIVSFNTFNCYFFSFLIVFIIPRFCNYLQRAHVVNKEAWL